MHTTRTSPAGFGTANSWVRKPCELIWITKRSPPATTSARAPGRYLNQGLAQSVRLPALSSIELAKKTFASWKCLDARASSRSSRRSQSSPASARIAVAATSSQPAASARSDQGPRRRGHGQRADACRGRERPRREEHGRHSRATPRSGARRRSPSASRARRRRPSRAPTPRRSRPRPTGRARARARRAGGSRWASACPARGRAGRAPAR